MKNRNNKPKHWGKFIKPLEDQNYNTLNSKTLLMQSSKNCFWDIRA